MPANALYTSPQIQTEIILFMAEIVSGTIVSEINESPFLTLMADGSTDRNGIEMISSAFRYIKHGTPTETLLAIETTEDLSVVGQSKVIFDRIGKSEINVGNIL